MTSPRSLKVVALGGGNGLSALLAGLKRVAIRSRSNRNSHSLTLRNITAIVTVTDDGGSSGRIRDQYPTPAPGDIRNCLVALAGDEPLMTDLFRYRFKGEGELRDHSLGNLLLTALTDITGDFHKAIHLSSQVLAIEGTILPSTTENVTLRALLEDGSEVRGETNISRASSSVRSIFLEPPSCRPLPEAIDAILKADIVTLGPGSLYTSLIPNLAVPGITEAIHSSHALKIYIGNLMTQPGETDRFTFSDHIVALQKHLGGRLLFTHALISSDSCSPTLVRRYRLEGAQPVVKDLHKARQLGVRVFQRKLLSSKTDKIRHDSLKLAAAVLEIYKKESQR
ncbi:MAG: uridine diphosphate-N-acetylglucosamine-binding protein YvcK [Acidobacteria bacterium]|nr:uridine diphosphate-N-acetylglucosamine-binding protein YvcK [Acidobacteriota bacterium]